MNLFTTLDGGLKLLLQEEQEWDMFRALLHDANCEKPASLAKQLGSKTAELQDWEDFILPDLEEQFSHNISCIYRLISEARKEAEDGVGEIFLDKKDSETWYLVLNQARLNLEAKYQLGPKENLDEQELSPTLKSILARDNFYIALQGALLSYVFPE